MPPNGVVILGLLIQKGGSIFETFSKTGYNFPNPRKFKMSTAILNYFSGNKWLIKLMGKITHVVCVETVVFRRYKSNKQRNNFSKTGSSNLVIRRPSCASARRRLIKWKLHSFLHSFRRSSWSSSITWT